MKLSMIVCKNLYLGCTGQIQFDDHSPEVIQKSIERGLLTGEESKIFQFENGIYYHLGYYDDETMNFEVFDEPVLLVRCSDVLSERKIKSKLLKEAERRESEDSSDGK